MPALPGQGCRWLAEGGEDFGGVFLGFDLGPNLLDAAFGVDEEGYSMHAHVFAAHEGFLAPNPVGGGDGLGVVGQEWKGQLELLYKFIVGLDGVGADAEHDGGALFEVVEGVAEGAGFFGASGGVVLWVEVKDDVVTDEVGQGYLLTAVDVSCEARGFIAYFECEHGFFGHVTDRERYGLCDSG